MYVALDRSASLADLKQTFFDTFHADLAPYARQVAGQRVERDKKAKLINSQVSVVKAGLREAIMASLPKLQQGNALLTLEYCASVASLTYRHQVWPYEYMAFSRRIGELWEGFCKACWEIPARDDVHVFEAPAFASVMSPLTRRIQAKLHDCSAKEDVLEDVGFLMDLIGEINMKEDMTFYVGEQPHIVDFKSGFGSNEKGNTIRLLSVAKAYRLWNPSSSLHLLVRQVENNNYLEILRRSQLWEVSCGQEAYDRMEEMTGVRVSSIKNDLVDFETDLGPDFMKHIVKEDLAAYLDW